MKTVPSVNPFFIKHTLSNLSLSRHVAEITVFRKHTVYWMKNILSALTRLRGWISIITFFYLKSFIFPFSSYLISTSKSILNIYPPSNVKSTLFFLTARKYSSPKYLFIAKLPSFEFCQVKKHCSIQNETLYFSKLTV